MRRGFAAVERGLSFEIRSTGDAVVVAICGEVDIATAPELAECLLIQRHRDVIVDLSGVGFLDSSGLNVLVQARRAAQTEGHTVHTDRESHIVRVAIEAAGLFAILHTDRRTPVSRKDT
jgi:anti-anti-sigma factor